MSQLSRFLTLLTLATTCAVGCGGALEPPSSDKGSSSPDGDDTGNDTDGGGSGSGGNGSGGNGSGGGGTCVCPAILYGDLAEARYLLPERALYDVTVCRNDVCMTGIAGTGGFTFSPLGNIHVSGSVDGGNVLFVGLNSYDRTSRDGDTYRLKIAERASGEIILDAVKTAGYTNVTQGSGCCAVETKKFDFSPGVTCCPISDEPSCCMEFGGTRGVSCAAEGPTMVCDNLPTKLEKTIDANGCPAWHALPDSPIGCKP